jgi:predicted nuclease of predicted toxin-antitoxin system
MPSAVTDALQQQGLDVLTVQAANRRGLPDDEQLDFATQENRVMVTMDSDYVALAKQGASHAGIVFVTSSTSIGSLINDLILLYGVMTPEEMENNVEYF